MVLVSHEKEFVFLKTRKTAGTSFEMMLEPWCAPPNHVVEEAAPEMVTEYGIVGARLTNKPGKKPFWRNHIGAKHVAHYLGPERWDRYTKLTAVRNPFSRAVSQFYWQFVWRELEVPQDLDGNRTQFRDYIMSDMFNSDFHVAHVNKVYCIDMAFRLEDIDGSIKRIGEKLDLPLSKVMLPRTKENSHTKPNIDFHALFEPDLEQEVREKEAWVFEHFGYSHKSDDAKL